MKPGLRFVIERKGELLIHEFCSDRLDRPAFPGNHVLGVLRISSQELPNEGFTIGRRYQHVHGVGFLALVGFGKDGPGAIGALD